MQGRLHSIQVLRAVAALAVAFSHAAGQPMASAGLDLFFVISGFIIGTVMIGREPWSFLQDRFRRIYPVYWCVLAPLAVVAVIHDFSAVRILSSITLWPVVNGEWIPPLLSPSWTLSFEMLFYLGAALSLLTRRPWIVMLLFAAAMTGFLMVESPFLRFVGNPIILEFGMGLLISRLPIKPLGIVGLPIAAAIFATSAPLLEYVGSVFLPGSAPLLRVLWWGIPSGLVVYACLGAESWFARAAFRPLVKLGDASYSLYLVHMPVGFALALWWPLNLTAMIVAALACHRWIERPLLKRSSGESSQRRDVIPAEVAAGNG